MCCICDLWPEHLKIMAPTKNKPRIGSTKPVQQEQKTVFEFSSYYERYKKYIFDPEHLGPVCCLLFVFEILLNVFIIERVNYTEIDWKAYMQEVEGFLNGTLDYKELKGDTGPLVYPAGFVYIYSALYYVTNRGQNIHLAQYIFLLIYLAQTLLTYRLYWKTVKIPPYALALATVTSYRVHSIFVLRLFNDPIAVLLFYVALNMFISDKWVLGSIFYSLGVSVKMNVLLYAPCLLIAYLTNLGVLQTAVHLAICAAVQLVLGLPFLLTNPFSYIKGSFDLGRIFEHKWTVNYRFLPIDSFENRLFHASLLVVHVVLLLIFAPIFKRYLTSYAKLNVVTQQVKEQLREERLKREKERQKADQKLSKQEKSFLDAFEKQMKKQPTAAGHDGLDETTKLENKMSKVTRLFVLPFFVANLIGIVCARSLHYQFYSWYFHSLLYLVFSTGYSKPVSFLLLGAIEYCWNVYPSTDMSSILLHLCHVILLIGVYRTMR